MRAYPDPKNAVRRRNAQRAIVKTYADGTEAANALEMQRWMLRIGLEQLEALVRKRADLDR